MPAVFAQIVPVVEDCVGGLPVWNLRGEVRRHPLAPDEAEIDFGEPVVMGNKPPVKVIRLRPNVPLASLTPLCDGRYATVSPPMPQFGSDGAFEFSVVPRADLTPGVYRFAVLLQGKLSRVGNDMLPDYPVRVTMHVRSDVEPTPPAVVFGLAPVGSILTDEIVLNSSRGPFTVLRVEVEPSGETQVDAIDSGDSRRRSFRLTQRVFTVGPTKKTVCFLVKRDGEAKPFVLLVPVLLEGRQT